MDTSLSLNEQLLTTCSTIVDPSMLEAIKYEIKQANKPASPTAALLDHLTALANDDQLIQTATSQLLPTKKTFTLPVNDPASFQQSGHIDLTEKGTTHDNQHQLPISNEIDLAQTLSQPQSSIAMIQNERSVVQTILQNVEEERKEDNHSKLDDCTDVHGQRETKIQQVTANQADGPTNGTTPTNYSMTNNNGTQSSSANYNKIS
ncbi:unnamed protein product [Didymodactylos carnosus]|uniref:Uncharacterized protein n=1 Tax=Didymodactylos carnosus TaxID=1234261 RepID=A0A8S2FDQ2_9BILA|nr:unnamed protein product [Didymodactylos carnosus]CAF4226428.1 unnamed protein product [Didymodactylos carnosus]